MSAPITAVRIPQSIPSIAPAASPQSPAGGEFQSVLSDAIGRVEQFQQNSPSSIDKFLSGEDEEVHKVALAVDQAADGVRPLSAGQEQSDIGLPGSDADADVGADSRWIRSENCLRA